MKQKLFTILTLLLCLCSTAWADPTFKSSFTDLTLTSATDGKYYTYLTSTNYASYISAGWMSYTGASTGSATLKIDPANDEAITGTSATYGKVKNNGSRYMEFYVTGITNIKFYFANTGSSDRKIQYILNGGSATDLVTVVQKTSDSGSITLNANTNNTIRIYSPDNDVFVCALKVTPGSNKPDPELSVSPTSVTLSKAGTQQITASATSTGTITYSSSNTSVATVSSSGLITAVGIGNADITTSIAETDNYASDFKLTKVIATPTALNITKYATFNTSMTSSPANYFTVTDPGDYNTKYTGTYGGTNYTRGLKVKTTSSVNFTTTVSCDLVVVQSISTNGTRYISIDGTAFATDYDENSYYDDATNNIRVYTVKGLDAGNHTITAASELGLLYIGVTEPLPPTLSVSPSEASAFTYVVDNGPSEAQTFTVSGTNLTATITATLSNTDAYEMRTGENEYGAGPLTDLASGTAVQVRLKSGLALGDSYSGDLTFSSTGADNKAVTLSGSVTNPIYAITKGTHANGDFTISPTSAAEGEEVTLTATPNLRYLFDSWSVYKTGDPTTTVTVTNNKFTMPAYAVTVDATFTADPKKQVLYLTSNGTVNDNDKLYAALAEDYTVTKAAFDATKTVTDFDLVVFHESIGGGNYNKNLVKAAIEADVPVLNTKSYFYGADQNANDRWKWGAPNAGTSVDGATINPAYGNIASHPIFEGVDISDAGFVTLFNAATAKAMQPVTALASGKEGYTLAITPNVAAVGGNGVAIHELSATQRGLTSGSAKYLMVSIGDGNGCFEKLTTNGQKLLKNAAAYLIDNTASWTPTTSVSGTITASGWNTFSSYAALDLSKINGGAAYVASATSGNSVTLTPVTDKIVAAGTGLMIKGTAGDDFTIDVATADADFTGTNLLVGLPNGGEVAKANNTDTWNYVFGWTDPTDPGFYLVNAKEPTLGAGKAYLQTTAALSTTTPARLNIVFEGETTAINGIEEVAPVTKTRKVVKNGRLVIETANGEFTVSGARVK